MKQKSNINIQIVIDSSVYRKDDTFTSSNIKQITELGKLGLVTIHIPWFVYMECTSGFIDTLKKELDKSVTAIDSFNTQTKGISNKLIITDSKKELLEKKAYVEQFVQELWKKYIHDSKAVLIDFDKSKSKVVFENYFKGIRPFSSLKNRKDIPDAFIYQELERISKFEVLYFISEDGNLLKEAAMLSNIKVFNGLDSLYSSKEYIPIKQEYDTISEYKEALGLVLREKHEIFKVVEEFIKSEKFRFLFEDVYIPSNTNEGSLTKVEKVKEIKLYEEKIKHIEQVIYLPIEIHVNGIVEYFKFTSDKPIKLADIYSNKLDSVVETYRNSFPLILSVEVEIIFDASKKIKFDFIPIINKAKVDSSSVRF